MTFDAKGGHKAHMLNVVSKAQRTAYSIGSHFHVRGGPSAFVAAKLVCAVLIPQITYSLQILELNQQQQQNLDQIIARPLRKALGLRRSTSALRVMWEFGVPPIRPSLAKIYLQSIFRSYCLRETKLANLPYHDFVAYANDPVPTKHRTLPHFAFDLLQRHHLQLPDLNKYLIDYVARKEWLQWWAANARHSAQLLKPEPGPARYLRIDHPTAARARARLRLRVSPTRYFLHKINKISSPNCTYCDAVDTEAHVLLFCRSTVALRTECRSRLMALPAVPARHDRLARS